MHQQLNISTTVRSAHTVFMCLVFIWEQTVTCVTYSINWLVFITEMKSVYSAVRTGSLNKAYWSRDAPTDYIIFVLFYFIYVIFSFYFFCCIIFYFTLLYFILFYFILLYFTLLYFTLLYFTLLYFTFYFTLLYFTLLYFTLLYFTLLYFIFMTASPLI